VNNQSPTTTITSPVNGATFAPGATITFTGSGTDHEDGTLTGASLVWTSSRDGQIGTGTSFTRNDLSLGVHNISLTATDRGGANGGAGVRITVAAVTPVKPGIWRGSTTGMSFELTVSSSGDAVTQIKYTFSGLQCGGATLVSGSIIVTPGTPWPIINRQFQITGSGNPKIDVTGTFSDDGATLSGTWSWSSCSGTWTGTAPAEPEIP
jgi:hypothetical protein